MEILNALRTATNGVHTRIENLPVCRAMLDGTINQDDYCRLLGSAMHLHARFEEMIESGVLPAWPATPSRAQAIERDLAFFDAEIAEAPLWLDEWIEDIERLDHPAAWAGVGYVFEGSRMGSRVLVRSVSKAFALEPRRDNGLDYHLDNGHDPNGTWRQVMAALVAADTDEHARHAIVSAAAATFEALYVLHEAAGVLEEVAS